MLSSLSVVIPAFNEAGSIASTVTDALVVGSMVASRLEVVVCNDGSSDNTASIVRSMGDPRVRLLDRPENAGIEASMRALYAHSRHDWIFLMSADQQWPMTTLLAMASAAFNGADFVVGTRSNKPTVYTPYRRVVSWGYERIVRILGSTVGDPGSIKLARRELLDIPVVARGVFAEGERTIRAVRSGARVVAVPVDFVPRNHGKATGARTDVVTAALTDALRVAASLMIGRPRPSLPRREF